MFLLYTPNKNMKIAFKNIFIIEKVHWMYYVQELPFYFFTNVTKKMQKW